MSSLRVRTNTGNVVQIELCWTRDAVIDLPDGSWEVRPFRPSGERGFFIVPGNQSVAEDTARAISAALKRSWRDR